MKKAQTSFNELTSNKLLVKTKTYLVKPLVLTPPKLGKSLRLYIYVI